MNDFEERVKALMIIVNDPNTPDDARFEARKELIDMHSDPDSRRRAALPYLDEILEGMRDTAQNSPDPEQRRQAKEYVEYLEFRKRALGEDDE
ncbi:hypothetical protein [Pseudomonas sp. NPDC089401]|uniref:hypothetical protein n=1 Tax=Pseudomonas sp. NPDC089401 TaxID=3364462 RepID=UPI00380D3F43